MDSENWKATSSLTTEVWPASSTNFFQLVENLAHHHGSDLSQLDKTHIDSSLFRFCSNPSMAFPSSDISQIQVISEENAVRQYVIETNFLGLNGSTSPLPGFYLEQIAYDHAQHIGVKNHFFDFFNHRLTVLLIKSWRKYKYYINFKAGINDEFSRKLFAFIGVGNTEFSPKKSSENSVFPLGSNDLADLEWHKLLYFMGVLVSRVRSPDMIASIITHYFNLKSARVLEWQKQKILISPDQTNRLGQANISLADDFILGNNVTSYAKKFVIVLDELDLTEFYDFLPRGGRNATLKKLIMFLMKDLLPYDIHLGIKLDTVPDFILGDEKHSLLGWTTFMNSDDKKAITSRVEIVGQA